MKSHALILLTAATFTLPAHGQEIPNPSFEHPVIPPSLRFYTPGSPGYAEEVVEVVGWVFGVQSGICLEGEAYAQGVTAADGQQVAFIQGQREEDDQSHPRNIFGVEMTGLEPGEEYEISWQQTGRITDAGTTAVSVFLVDAQKRPKPLMTEEPVGTKGEWESKSVWFVATAPTMGLQIRHFILESGNSNVGTESTLFDNFKIRAAKSVP